MKSIERRFSNIAERRPSLSTFACFGEAVRGQNFSRQCIRRWFHKLVDEDDYAARDKKDLLAHFEALTKTP
jgi:hypothetical protein